MFLQSVLRYHTQTRQCWKEVKLCCFSFHIRENIKMIYRSSQSSKLELLKLVKVPERCTSSWDLMRCTPQVLREVGNISPSCKYVTRSYARFLWYFGSLVTFQFSLAVLFTHKPVTSSSDLFTDFFSRLSFSECFCAVLVKLSVSPISDHYNDILTVWNVECEVCWWPLVYIHCASTLSPLFMRSTKS